MIDPYGRTIDYLRVSLTDQCNLRCVYCMPEEGLPFLPKEQTLTDDELVRIVRVAAAKGVRKVRLTGGEPLMRRDLPALVARIASLPGIEDLSATTNGYLLARDAQALAASGLHRVNVSLDTLDPGRFKEIARRGSLDRVLAGIQAALEAGLAPLKLNCVVMRGLNDHEAEAFAEWTTREPVHVRFIELMPIRWNLDDTPAPVESHIPAGSLNVHQAEGGMLSDLQMRRLFVPWAETRSRIEAAHGALDEAQIPTNGPARAFRIPGAPGTVGFISQISDDLCVRCNRLRLTSDGFLRPCLMEDGELDLRTPLREGCDDAFLAGLFEHVVANKPARHYLAEGQKVRNRAMSQIGG
ncbi:MAG: GTP 3',8-cyclase MoaA [Fimbriimonadaceae bacterium]|nr:GTP 3',8-cyclase MoaA [Fimbriimonadaceae bacterium]